MHSSGYLANGLQHCRNLKGLQVAFNQIGDAGAARLVIGLRLQQLEVASVGRQASRLCSGPSRLCSDYSRGSQMLRAKLLRM